MTREVLCNKTDKLNKNFFHNSLKLLYLQFVSFRYCCYICDLSLCSACADREATLLTRKASSLHLSGSRRSSLDAEQLLLITSRKSSHIVHPANLPNLRRLSAASQAGGRSQSSRKSSKCDEKCLSRRSSNIQQTINKINDNKNGDKCEKIVTDPQRISYQRLTNKAENEATVTGPITAFSIERNNKTDKDYETCKISAFTKGTEKLIPKNVKPSIPTSKISIPINCRRRHSSMNLLDSASLPVHSSRRRSSCVILLLEVQEENGKFEEQI